jgi:hypothetical protein
LVLKKVVLKFKPMVLAVTEEREGVYNALKGQFEGLLAMANDSALPQKLRLRATGLAVQLAEVMKGILKDVDLDEFRAEMEKLMVSVESIKKERARERYL